MSLESLIQKFGGVTESYWFYNNTVELRYDVKNHVYLLATPNGLEVQDGVTHICHILDKSSILLPWGSKMMAQKLIATAKDFATGYNITPEGVKDYYSFHEPAFTKWIMQAKSAHRDKLEDAGAVGTEAHNWIETYIGTVLTEDAAATESQLSNFPVEPRAQNAVVAMLDWSQNHNVRFLGTERKIYSRRYKYAGTMDGLARADSCNNPLCCKEHFKDRLTLIDWKTSNYLYVEFILQTAAYMQAYEEETGEQVEDIWIIRLGKEDAEFEAWHVDSQLATLGWIAFLRALELSRSMADLNRAMEDSKDHRKAAKKAEKKATKEADLKVACKGAKTYKGVRRPKCNGGNPCETCLKKYADRLASLESLRDQKVEKKEVKSSPELLTALQNLLDKSA
jgi:hypothetical protein